MLTCHECGTSLHIGTIAPIIDNTGGLFCPICTQTVACKRMLERQNDRLKKWEHDNVGVTVTSRCLPQGGIETRIIVPENAVSPDQFDMHALFFDIAYGVTGERSDEASKYFLRTLLMPTKDPIDKNLHRDPERKR